MPSSFARVMVIRVAGHGLKTRISFAPRHPGADIRHQRRGPHRAEGRHRERNSTPTAAGLVACSPPRDALLLAAIRLFGLWRPRQQQMFARTQEAGVHKSQQFILSKPPIFLTIGALGRATMRSRSEEIVRSLKFFFALLAVAIEAASAVALSRSDPHFLGIAGLQLGTIHRRQEGHRQTLGQVIPYGGDPIPRHVADDHGLGKRRAGNC